MSKVDEFLENEAKGTKIIGARSLEEMVKKLKKPRRVMLLVKAGSAVDAFIDSLVSLCDRIYLNNPKFWKQDGTNSDDVVNFLIIFN